MFRYCGPPLRLLLLAAAAFVSAQTAANADPFQNTPFDLQTWKPHRPPEAAYVDDPQIAHWNRWAHKDGVFIQCDDAWWVEVQQGKHIFTFRERSRGEEGIVLYDASRNIDVSLRETAYYFRRPEMDWAKAGDGCGLYLSNTYKNKAGSVFVFTGDRVTETHSDGLQSRFRITGYRPNAVVLHDSDRKLNVVLSHRMGVVLHDNGAVTPWPGSEGSWVKE